jgi:hypothetical protein
MGVSTPCLLTAHLVPHRSLSHTPYAHVSSPEARLASLLVVATPKTLRKTVSVVKR